MEFLVAFEGSKSWSCNKRSLHQTSAANQKFESNLFDILGFDYIYEILGNILVATINNSIPSSKIYLLKENNKQELKRVEPETSDHFGIEIHTY